MKEKSDEVMLGPEISNGVHVGARRRGGGEIEPMCFIPAKEGTPIPPGGELVQLGGSSCECGAWRKSETLYKAPKAAGDGPAQVATDAYREGHDRIFGKGPKVGLA